MTQRIHKTEPLNVRDDIAQAVYRGRLMLGDHGLVWDTQTNEWHDMDGWKP